MYVKRPEPQTTDERLDEILFLLRKFQTRDKWRTFWGSIGGIVRLLPILVTLYFAYYFYQNGEEMIQQAIEASASAATSKLGDSSSFIIENVNPEQLQGKIKDLLQGGAQE